MQYTCYFSLVLFICAVILPVRTTSKSIQLVTIRSEHFPTNSTGYADSTEMHFDSAIPTSTLSLRRSRELRENFSVISRIDESTRINDCWPHRQALSPLPVPDYIHRLQSNLETSQNYPKKNVTANRKSIDILQVVAKVTCIVEANILSIYEYQSNHFSILPTYVHVLVTLDMDPCSNMANQSGLVWTHVRCVDERHVFGDKLSKKIIETELSKVGSHARTKGASWFFQQFLKIEAAALGVGGLGDKIRIIDGDVLVLKKPHWFFGVGGVIYDSCYSKNDGNNGFRYGHTYFVLTGRRLIGGPDFVAHSMSVSRKHAQRLRMDLDTNSVDVSRDPSWVFKSLQVMCDANSITGFSEYWYLLTSTIHHYPEEVALRVQNPGSPPYCTRLRSGGACTGSIENTIQVTRDAFPSATYVVFESHLSRFK